MSKFNRLVVAAALVSTAFSVAGVSAQSKAPTVPVKIGIMAPITGPAGSIGTEQLNWAQMAVDNFNKANGWTIELVQGDTQLDAAKAVTVADSLISNNDIYGVVGPAGSQEVEATAAKFKDARLVEISGSATRPSLTTSGNDTFFRVVPTDAAQGPTDADFLAKTLGKTKLFIIDDQTSYATGLADSATTAFKADGGTIVDHQSVTQKDTDFSALVTRIKSSGADAVFFPAQIASQGALLAQQLVEQNVKAVLLGSDGQFDPDKFVKGAGGATEGDYVSSFAPDIHGLAADADMVKAYTDKYGEFGTFGPAMYAATQVVLDGIKAASDAGTLTRAAVRDAVAKTKQAQSILGIPISFDKNGDVEGAQFFLFKVEKDAFVLVPSASAGASATMAATMSADLSATMAATAAK